MVDAHALNGGLKEFLQSSPTPFHAVSNMAASLQEAGYLRLLENEQWSLQPGQGYFVTRNDSSLIALRIGSGDISSAGFRMVGAHTDSPCLKVKPQPEIVKQGYGQLGVEVYGGVLLNPWFDRDLSIAGRVHYQTTGNALASVLVDFERPVAVIPSLAIHLDRQANESRAINAQTYLPPLLLQLTDKKEFDFRELLLDFMVRSLALDHAVKVLDYELCLYDVQPPALVGLNQEFITAARLDNLLSCYVGLQSLLASEADNFSLLVCSDHEEVGSVSAAGASGPFLEAVLERIGENLAGPGQENKRRLLDNSILLSVDNAHGIHPNFADKHDDKHGPLLNRGPVIKINANQRYASNSETSAFFRRLCEQVDVPVQAFVVRNDMACGSTIGPIVAGELGVRTLDLGVPTFAMHSIRETAGSRDAAYLATALTAFFSR